MVASFRRRVALSLLIALLASFGSWQLQARALAHQIEHAIGPQPVPAMDEHDHHHDHDVPRSDTPVQDGDHAVLHAVGAAAAVVASGTSQPCLDHAGIVRTPFDAPPIEHATADPPYRPPRTTPTLA
jgi:hypothetical protein